MKSQKILSKKLFKSYRFEYSVFFWTVILIFLRLMQHYSFGTNALDLSLYDYAMSFTLKGETMMFPFLGPEWRNLFSIHFSPILFLFVPFYLIFKGPVFLLILQVIFGALSAYVYYLIVKHLFNSEKIAFFIAFIYLIYRPFLNGLTYDFHPEMIFPLLIFLNYYFLKIKPSFYGFIITFILALAIKEDCAVYLFFYGIFIWLYLKKKKEGVVVMVVSFIYCFIILYYVIPHFRSLDGVSAQYEFLSPWKMEVENFSKFLIFIISHPVVTLKNIFEWNIFFSYANVFSPLLVLIPFFTPYGLLVFPPIIVALLSKNPGMATFGIYYISIILPFLFLAFAQGLKRIKIKSNQSKHLFLKKKLWKILIITLVVFGVTNTKWNLFNPKKYQAKKSYYALVKIKKEIPQSASIAIQSCIVPHIPKRKKIFILPQDGTANYILLNSNLNPWPMNTEELIKYQDKLLKSFEYSLISENQGFLLFKKDIQLLE